MACFFYIISHSSTVFFFDPLEGFSGPSTVFVVVILHRDLSRHGGIVASPQFGHGWVGVGCTVHLGLAPYLKYFELVISFAEIEAEMTEGRDGEFENEMSVGEAKFSSSSFLLRLSSVFSFILILVLCAFFPFLNQVSIHVGDADLVNPHLRR